MCARGRAGRGVRLSPPRSPVWPASEGYAGRGGPSARWDGGAVPHQGRRSPDEGSECRGYCAGASQVPALQAAGCVGLRKFANRRSSGTHPIPVPGSFSSATGLTPNDPAGLHRADQVRRLLSGCCEHNPGTSRLTDASPAGAASSLTQPVKTQRKPEVRERSWVTSRPATCPACAGALTSSCAGTPRSPGNSSMTATAGRSRCLPRSRRCPGKSATRPTPGKRPADSPGRSCMTWTAGPPDWLPASAPLSGRDGPRRP